MSYALLITGSRYLDPHENPTQDWLSADERFLSTLQAWLVTYGLPVRLFEGECRGVDLRTKEFFLANGLSAEDVDENPARWELYNKRAGTLRNLEMLNKALDFCQQHLVPLRCLAFLEPASSGTAHMVSQIERLQDDNVHLTKVLIPDCKTSWLGEKAKPVQAKVRLGGKQCL